MKPSVSIYTYILGTKLLFISINMFIYIISSLLTVYGRKYASLLVINLHHSWQVQSCNMSWHTKWYEEQPVWFIASNGDAIMSFNEEGTTGLIANYNLTQSDLRRNTVFSNMYNNDYVFQEQTYTEYTICCMAKVFLFGNTISVIFFSIIILIIKSGEIYGTIINTTHFFREPGLWD